MSARSSNAKPGRKPAKGGDSVPSAPACIRLRGVRQNNLKGFDLDLPLGKWIVITGLSGSGKSSLGFETLYAEGQRRYIETFSPYARQFFDRMDKPAVDRIENIPPAIALEQRNSVRTTRSTVGTMTEICDHMKVLWSHLAKLHCRQCGRVVRKDVPPLIWAEWQPSSGESAGEALLTFDLPLSDKLSMAEQLALVARQGFQRILMAGEVVRIEDAGGREQGGASQLTVVQDRVRLSTANRQRFIEACEQAFHFGRGRLSVRAVGGDLVRRYSTALHCAQCDLVYKEPSPALFSFNHPLGACNKCRGFGRVIDIDYGLVMPDLSLTLEAGVVKPWQGGVSAECQADLIKMARKRGVPLDVPFRQLSPDLQRWVIDGEPGYIVDDPAHSWPKLWYGVKGYFRWLESKAYKMHVRVLLSRYRSYTTCPDCHGQRFNPDSLLYCLEVPPTAGVDSPGSAGTLTLSDFYRLPVSEASALVERIRSGMDLKRSDPLATVLAEVGTRLGYLVEVGLGYLTLDRPTRTLSGGETERVNLTTCLGTRLVNTLFVLDEPSVGLHPRDTERLIAVLKRLRDTGNTVVVIEHETSLIRSADYLVDIGPGHGESGGNVVFSGSPSELARAKGSLTADYLTGRRQIPEATRRPVALMPSGELAEPCLRLSNATANNLKSLQLDIPLGRLVCITGVSGSGKSTLVREVLVPLLESRIRQSLEATGAAGDSEDGAGEGSDVEGGSSDDEVLGNSAANSAATLSGWESLGGVVMVDQTSLGKTPRSNPAVYVGAFEAIRDLFASTTEARDRGLNASAFSFNSRSGQCARCRGAGFEKIEMQFLSDVFVRCPECHGRRYRTHILDVKVEPPVGLEDWEGEASWSIADFLEAPMERSVAWLKLFGESGPAKRAAEALQLLCDVGLGYLRAGQPINTLSGGESQRLKLAAFLATAGAIPGGTTGGRGKPYAASRPVLFVFDEPTTGLHVEDVRVLLEVFHRMVGAGHSVVIIEHNLEVIRSADWIVDLGPEAGEGGGSLVVAGPPEQVAACARSHTGRFLRELGKEGGVRRR